VGGCHKPQATLDNGTGRQDAGEAIRLFFRHGEPVTIMVKAPVVGAALALTSMLAAESVEGSFHLMQIEQVIGGVMGDVSQQAVQLRMRSSGQNLVQFSRLRVFDAAGSNPLLLVDMNTQVPNGAPGDRVLIASAEFAARQGPTPNFLMGGNIPPAYFAGGRLTFESDGGDVLFSLCWGTYTGPTTGTTDNDADGQFGPCVPGPLPFSDLSALHFGGNASAPSTSNAANFALTPDAAVFTNNARVSAALVVPPFSDRGGDCNDTDSNVFPGQLEVDGNRIDDDCDGLADEDANNQPSSDNGDNDSDGWSLAQGDCDDSQSGTSPAALEFIGDRRDNDCDGRADEDGANLPSPDGIDHDNDGYAMFGRVFASGFEL
jgi:hypothetical protein